MKMSAKIAEALAKVADLHAQLAEGYTELSALYDVDSAKSGGGSDDGTAGKVSGKGGKTAVASKTSGGKGKPAVDDDDELPPPKAAAKKGGKAKAKVTEDDLRGVAKELIEKLGEKAGKEKVVEVLGGKLADVEEEDYAEKLEGLQEALKEAEEEDEI
jgi:hypothetical protein